MEGGGKHEHGQDGGQRERSRVGKGKQMVGIGSQEKESGKEGREGGEGRGGGGGKEGEVGRGERKRGER